MNEPTIERLERWAAGDGGAVVTVSTSCSAELALSKRVVVKILSHFGVALETCTHVVQAVIGLGPTDWVGHPLLKDAGLLAL